MPRCIQRREEIQVKPSTPASDGPKQLGHYAKQWTQYVSQWGIAGAKGCLNADAPIPTSSTWALCYNFNFGPMVHVCRVVHGHARVCAQVSLGPHASPAFFASVFIGLPTNVTTKRGAIGRCMSNAMLINRSNYIISIKSLNLSINQ